MPKFLIALCLLISQLGYSQLPDHNLNHVGQLAYQPAGGTQPILNDIWGYVDSSGTEYALVGHNSGVSIVSLADPTNPVEVAFVPANNSTWRDIKTYGNYAYAVTEGGGGILIMNLSNLPTSVSHHFHTNNINAAHNLWIDEQGILYSVGGGIGAGEPFLYDVATDPDTPIFLGMTTPPFYSHDAYVRGDTMWSANINDGFFTVFDVSDKSNPVLLATQTTSRDFCHNVWLSDDGQTLFTTDEKSGAWIDAYDVSDLGDITELDRWRTPNPGVVPHNVHVDGDYLVISYYDDGLVILDASRPHNLVEVARYDTYPLTPNSEFDGAWGAYPYLPSGRILVSDRQTGLHVFERNYQHACWLEGVVTDSITGASIFGANISISGPTTISPEYSNLLGNYATGTHQAGNYQVTFSKLGYISKTVSTNLQNGIVTIENIQLVASPTSSFSLNVKDSLTNTPIQDAVIEIRGKNVDTTYIGTTNTAGTYTHNLLHGDYEVWVGRWGHHTKMDSFSINNSLTLTMELSQGYKDEFALDLDWTSSQTSTTGTWTILEPYSAIFLLDHDANDLGTKCQTTGPYPSPSGFVWQDFGTSRLHSPLMDLSQAQDPAIHFQYHFFSLINTNDNFLDVYLTTPNDTVLVASFDSINNIATWKTAPLIRIQDFLSLRDSMQVHFHSNNTMFGGSNNIRTWVDDFEIRDATINTIQSLETATTKLQSSPNPFQQSFLLSFESTDNPIRLKVYNALGQCIEQRVIYQSSGSISLGTNWENGIYFIQTGNQTIKVLKER